MSIKIILSLSIVGLTLGYGESLNDTVQEAISKNPQIQEASLNLKASMHELEVAEAGYKPTLDVRAEEGRERTNSPANERELKIYNEEQVSIVGKYNLFAGFETRYKISEKSESVELAKNQLNEKANKIALLTTQVYLDVLRKKELFEITHTNYQLHLDTLNKVTTRVRAGDGYESDVKQTESRVDLARLNSIIAKKNYEQSQINYRRLLLDIPNVENMNKPIISYEEDLKMQKTSSDDEIKKAHNQNFQIKIEESKNKISDYLFKQQESKYYPTVDLEVSKNYNDNIYGIKGRDDSSKIAVVLNYNIYNGGADKASKLAALKRHEMTLKSKEDTKLTTEESLRISLLQYNILTTQTTLLESQLKHLERTIELYDKEYQNSKRTIIDVLNVKQEYNYAKSQEVNTVYDKLLTYYQFKSVMGDLLREYNLNIFNAKSNNQNLNNDENFELLTKALNNESK